MSRPPYRHANLSRLLNPDSIAVIGASPRPTAFGQRLLQNLSRYTGRVYPINAKYDRINDLPCFPDLASLPEVPDCVVIAAAREQVEPLMRECGRLRVGGVVLFASGYAETGKPERIAEQQELVRIARESGVPLVGPNCIGVVNYTRGAVITFSGAPHANENASSSIGLVSQSGALGFAMSQAIEHGVSFSHVLTCGNSADVDVADYVAFLAEDDACSAIALLFEGMSDPLRLMQAAEIARAANKPLIVYKIATGEQGAAAAMSHTGSLAGSKQAYQAAFDRAGIIVVDEFSKLVQTAAFFSKARAPVSDGVAVVSTSGGAAIMAADTAEIHGVPLPQPNDDTSVILHANIPEYGSPRNPCDITAQVLSDPASFTACVDALLADPTYGVLVVPFVFSYDTATPRIAMLNEAARRHGKMVCIVWLTEWLEGPGTREAETSSHVALFRSMDTCFSTLAHWHARHRRANPALDAPRAAIAESVREQVGRTLAQNATDTVTESAAKAVLAAYGIPMAPDFRARDVDAAVSAAGQCGYPVVLKVESARIPHKTEAGVVRIKLGDEAAVRSAYDAIMANALRVAPADTIEGVLVQPMVQGELELMIGVKIDPQFGPMVVVGLGGILVELMRDSAIALAPVNHAQALEMLRSLKGFKLLAGFRGSEPVDLNRLADIICRVGDFAVDHQDQITELDINPLICGPGHITGVDALIGLRRS
nr:acetate--CoA ligase family protein [Pseudomonas sp.]